MADELAYQSITGHEAIVDWFGCWPSFHDAEVVDIELHRAGRSRLHVHTFEMTNEVDERSRYKLNKHAIVTFSFEEISSMELRWFNQQNVLSDLSIELSSEQITILLGHCFGVEGHIASQRVSVSIKPGVPEDGIYASEKS
ncbi:Imm50 family immunity protein [Terriglobus sp. TAA 43]|uniref:Imm50 family immunity protein n=1 Tax=Terriglobus sp. TAA 43 TaxID=278961 RepID=UPI0006468D5C|nr:Imm50 family immunity protein [Terriglobus sp. TAA 43]